MRDGCPLAPRLPLPSSPLSLFDPSKAEDPLFISPPFAGVAENFDDVRGTLGVPLPTGIPLPTSILEQLAY